MAAREAVEYLQVSPFTLDKIERAGGLATYRTPGGAPPVQCQDVEPIPE